MAVPSAVPPATQEEEEQQQQQQQEQQGQQPQSVPDGKPPAVPQDPVSERYQTEATIVSDASDYHDVEV